MVKGKDYRDFEKMVKKAGYKIEHTTNHHKIVDKNGNRLMNFAVLHKKGGKRQVLQCYVSKFLEKTEPE